MFSSYGNPDATKAVDVCVLIDEFQSFVAQAQFPFHFQVAFSLFWSRHGTPVEEVLALSDLAPV